MMTGFGHIAWRSLGSRRGALSVMAAVLSALVFCGMSVPLASANGVSAGQALVILLHSKTAHTSPSVRARTMTIVASARPLTGARTVLPALGHVTDKHGRSWVDVRLPGRPNSSSGWISTDGTMPSWTPWRLAVNLNARVLTVYYRGRATERFPAIVGRPSTPTSQGSFFIEEGLWMGSGAAGGPYALATSDRSDVLLSSTAARVRLPSMGWTISRARSERRPRTVASVSQPPQSPGSPCASVPACH